jgi:hypothetical protein
MALARGLIFTAGPGNALGCFFVWLPPAFTLKTLWFYNKKLPAWLFGSKQSHAFQE